MDQLIFNYLVKLEEGKLYLMMDKYLLLSHLKARKNGKPVLVTVRKSKRLVSTATVSLVELENSSFKVNTYLLMTL